MQNKNNHRAIMQAIYDDNAVALEEHLLHPDSVREKFYGLDNFYFKEVVAGGRVECLKKLIESKYPFVSVDRFFDYPDLIKRHIDFKKHSEIDKNKNKFLIVAELLIHHYNIDLNKNRGPYYNPLIEHTLLSPDFFSLYLKLGANPNSLFQGEIYPDKNGPDTRVELEEYLKIIISSRRDPELKTNLKILKEFKIMKLEKEDLEKVLVAKKAPNNNVHSPNSTKGKI